MKKRVIALGFFDGVHLGHGALLQRTVQRAAERDAVSAVMTFDRHPSVLLKKEPVPLLNTPEDRRDLMQRLYGIREVIVTPFDRKRLQEPWEVFLEQYLVGQLQACHTVCGHNYHFGYRGLGDPEKLQRWCREHGLGCDVIDEVKLDGQPVCSTRIRALLAQGELETANRCLGHPHCLSGKVIDGRHLGRTLGVPTANLALPEAVLELPHGVYATRATVDGKTYIAVTNVGNRPTVNGHHVTVEPWLLDFDGDLYGQTIRVDFHRFLRPERKFPSLELLKQEICRNAEQTREYFATKI